MIYISKFPPRGTGLWCPPSRSARHNTYKMGPLSLPIYDDVGNTSSLWCSGRGEHISEPTYNVVGKLASLQRFFRCTSHMLLFVLCPVYWDIQTLALGIRAEVLKPRREETIKGLPCALCGRTSCTEGSTHRESKVVDKKTLVISLSVMLLTKGCLLGWNTFKGGAPKYFFGCFVILEF